MHRKMRHVEEKKASEKSITSMRVAELQEPCGGIENWSKYSNATLQLVVLLPAGYGYTRQVGEDRSMSDFKIRGLNFKSCARGGRVLMFDMISWHILHYGTETTARISDKWWGSVFEGCVALEMRS